MAPCNRCDADVGAKVVPLFPGCRDRGAGQSNTGGERKGRVRHDFAVSHGHAPGAHRAERLARRAAATFPYGAATSYPTRP